MCYLVELEVLNPQIHVPLMNIMINGGTVEGVALPAATRIVFEEGSHPGGFICQVKGFEKLNFCKIMTLDKTNSSHSKNNL